MGIAIAPGIEVPERDLQFRFLRSPGPGGQNVNKVASAVELRFNVAGCSALDDWTRMRLATLAGRRLSREGWLVLDAHRHRSQERNRADALERLAELLVKAMHRPKPRRPTRPTQGAKRRRLAAKQGRGETKRLRGKPDLE